MERKKVPYSAERARLSAKKAAAAERGEVVEQAKKKRTKAKLKPGRNDPRQEMIVD